MFLTRILRYFVGEVLFKDRGRTTRSLVGKKMNLNNYLLLHAKINMESP